MLLSNCFVFYSFVTVSSSSTSSSNHLYASANFFLTFSEDLDIYYKLRLFTPCSSYGAEEMTPKSQLCACSFPDTFGYQTHLNTLRVDANLFVSAKKHLRKKNFQIRVDMASLLIFDVLLNIYILSVVAAVNSYKVYGYLSCFA